MGSIAGEDSGNGGGGKEERILVSVRVRPLNDKEIEGHDALDWECINNDTVIFKNSLPDRATYPNAYTFDRVFGCNSTTKQVYENGAREVALSVVSGINSSIFAYGQTSSGKTYTMTGITEYGVSEIYDYIHKHPDREFVLKFSAIEIYNEAVKDLLSPDSGQLRLLDDPEKGTIVENLTEEIPRDQAHLQELIYFCAAQRQIGETTLNEMSSRSHQILRLSIESTARELSGRDNFSTLTATVNFVDLAGSERASQALTAGSRLKEGCHINRSLLTLGTVIRKLSKGRNRHVPYRDSKLTRILQSSLGGNARTAIICTMSPAHSHIEQSRNTLQFASCAKEVVVSARVNVVMSDKALVKHLRKELARMENELRYMGLPSITRNSDVLKDKDAQIKLMEKEMRELMKQRDLAQSRLEDLLRAVGDDHGSGQWEEISHTLRPYAPISYEDTLSSSASSGVSYQIPEGGVRVYAQSYACSEYTEYDHQSEDQHAMSPLSHSASAPTITRPEENSPFASPDLNSHYKDVRCIEKIVPSLNNIEDDAFDLLSTDDIDSLLPPSVDANDFLKIPTLKETIEAEDGLEKTVDEEEDCEHEPRSEGDMDLKVELPAARELGSDRRPRLLRSRSCRAALMAIASSLSFPEVLEYKATLHDDIFNDFTGRLERSQTGIPVANYGDEHVTRLENGSENSENRASSDDLKDQPINDGSITSASNQLEEVIHFQHQEEHQQELDPAAGSDSEVKTTIKDVCMDPVLISSESPSRWHLEFEKKQREIVELWHECNVSLIHRSCFFILIKGDPADSIYMEVEHRRLSFLKSSSSEEHVCIELSLKGIRREREKMCRLMNRMPLAERESLYAKWGIALDSKQRRMQLARRVWTDTKDMDHVRESAMLVANLFGFLEPGLAPKEMFGLSFTPQLASGRSFNRKFAPSARR